MVKTMENKSNSYLLDVSIILVNYKTPDFVKEVVKSIRNKSNGFTYEIIVVDNSNDSLELSKIKTIDDNKYYVINAKENLGFGKANNLGASIARGKYLFFLNTDTLLLNNAIFELFCFLENNGNVGIVGSNLYTIEGKPNHSYSLCEKNIAEEKRENSIFHVIRTRLFFKRTDFNYSNVPLEIKGYVCGAALMIRSRVFHEIGGFDKDIFMYAEESLLCYKVIHEKHMKIFNAPSSKIIHFEGGSFGKVSSNRAKIMVDGNYVYYLKVFGERGAYEYLHVMLKLFKKKQAVSRVLFKRKFVFYSMFVEAYSNKIKYIRKETI